MPKQKTNKNQPFPRGEIIIYQDPRGKAKLEARLQNETIWLTQAQIAILFGTQRPAITKHLHNIFKAAELSQNSVCSILEHTAADGKTYKTQCYNLDAIISVGYRVNSQRATQFRIWATRVLKEHIVRGYTLNEKHLREQTERLSDLQKALAFIRSKIKRPELAGQADELLSVIQDYTTSLTLLHQYDQGLLTLQHQKKSAFKLTYETCQKLITETKQKLIQRKETSNLFGQEYGDKFKSVLGSLYQTFGGRELYASVEEKAAHLLYLTIKDHPFADGNKRIAALLFVFFLSRANYLLRPGGERKISDTTLVALALLVAESDPKEKGVMIALITNLL